MVLVTAAAGGHGSVGPQLVHELVAGGHQVRAMVRKEDARCAALRSAGAEVVVGDFLSLASMRNVLSGIESAFFCYPLTAGLVQATTIFCAAAKDAGVVRVVNASLMLAGPDHPSPICTEHWLSERILDWADLGVVHLRGGFFYENVLRFAAAGIAKDNRLYFPFADGEVRAAWVSGRDMAAAARGALFGEFKPGTTFNVTDVEPLSIKEVALAIGKNVQRPVAYEAVKFPDFVARIDAQLGDNSYLRRHIAVLAAAMGSGRVIGKASDAVYQLSGRQPAGIAQFATDYREVFSPSE
ncbi:NAD(P)H-binding protein [Methylocapsa aurea]|uniref:NmrA family NAD(P)-binding protein n=1 Tax=Methylocapsa aurea TaxID=663610 RepID=UPI003D18FA1D